MIVGQLFVLLLLFGILFLIARLVCWAIGKVRKKELRGSILISFASAVAIIAIILFVDWCQSLRKELRWDAGDSKERVLLINGAPDAIIFKNEDNKLTFEMSETEAVEAWGYGDTSWLGWQRTHDYLLYDSDGHVVAMGTCHGYMAWWE